MEVYEMAFQLTLKALEMGAINVDKGNYGDKEDCVCTAIENARLIADFLNTIQERLLNPKTE